MAASVAAIACVGADTVTTQALAAAGDAEGEQRRAKLQQARGRACCAGKCSAARAPLLRELLMPISFSGGTTCRPEKDGRWWS